MYSIFLVQYITGFSFMNGSLRQCDIICVLYVWEKIRGMYVRSIIFFFRRICTLMPKRPNCRTEMLDMKDLNLPSPGRLVRWPGSVQTCPAPRSLSSWPQSGCWRRESCWGSCPRTRSCRCCCCPLADGGTPAGPASWLGPAGDRDLFGISGRNQVNPFVP